MYFVRVFALLAVVCYRPVLSSSQAKEEKRDPEHWTTIDQALVAEYKDALAYVKTLPAGDLPKLGDNDTTTSQEKQLRFYGWFNQARSGDQTTARPTGFLAFVAKAKWDAWNAVKGKTTEECMNEYINMLTQLAPEWREATAAEEEN